MALVVGKVQFVDSPVKLPPQLDYRMRHVVAPRYKTQRIPLNNFAGASSGVQAPGSSVQLEFKLPAIPYNLSKSYVQYTVEVTPGANFAYNWEDVFDLASSVTFGSAGGVDLVSITTGLQNYTKIMRKLDTPLEDFLGNDNMSGLYKSNATATFPNVVPGGAAGQPAGSVTAFPSEPYTEPAYIRRAYTTNAAGISTLAGSGVVSQAYRQYPLNGIKGTLLSVDRDFYSPIEQYLRFTTSIPEKTAFAVATAADMTVPANPVGVSFNNIYLYLAVEKNQEILDTIMVNYHAGKLAYRIPYTTVFKTIGALANQTTNISIQLSQQYGKRLKRITTSAFHPTESGLTAYDCNNFNGLKTLSYQTFLDSLPLQDRVISCLRPSGQNVNMDDWAENKKFLDRFSVITSKEMYQTNWFHCDQFYEPRGTEDQVDEANLDEGLIMDTAKTYLFSSQNGAVSSLPHYTFAEFQREIAITNGGPLWI